MAHKRTVNMNDIFYFCMKYLKALFVDGPVTFFTKIVCFLPALFSFGIFFIAAYSARFLCGIAVNRKVFSL